MNGRYKLLNPSFAKDRAHLMKKGKERAPISSAKPDTCGGPVDGEEMSQESCGASKTNEYNEASRKREGGLPYLQEADTVAYV